jgi:hypothetical protein
MATTTPIHVQQIHVKAVDNELYILASNGAGSSEICHLKAGNNNKVDYTVILPKSILPPGAYTLIMVGINWGSGYAFSVDLIGPAGVPPTPYTAPPSPPAPPNVGVVWTVSVPITV